MIFVIRTECIYHFCFTVVATQGAKGPGGVIVRPGQDVELLCTFGRSSTTRHEVKWIINHNFYGVNALSGSILANYSADTNNNNLLVQNIVMNDDRNDTEHRCVVVNAGTIEILNNSDPTFLYIAGKY